MPKVDCDALAEVRISNEEEDLNEILQVYIGGNRMDKYRTLRAHNLLAYHGGEDEALHAEEENDDGATKKTFRF